MAAKKQVENSVEDLYMLVNSKTYRKCKSEVLRGQADLLTALKKIHNLQVLARKKRDLKKKFRQLLSSTNNSISKIQEKMPEPKVPKKMIKKTVEEPTFTKEKNFPKKKVPRKSSFRDEIDEELQQIQDKLNQING